MGMKIVLKEDDRCMLCGASLPAGTKVERSASRDLDRQTGKYKVHLSIAHLGRCPNEPPPSTPLTDAMRYCAAGSFGSGSRRK